MEWTVNDGYIVYDNKLYRYLIFEKNKLDKWIFFLPL